MAVRKIRDDRAIIRNEQAERRAGLVASVLRVVEREDEQTDSLIAALQPDRVLGSAAVEQARLNAAARDEFVQSWHCYTSAEVADVVGSRATNRAASAHRLLRRGEIFQVRYGSDTLVPAFQFSPHGEPKPAVAAGARAAARGRASTAGSSRSGSSRRTAGSRASSDPSTSSTPIRPRSSPPPRHEADIPE